MVIWDMMLLTNLIVVFLKYTMKMNGGQYAMIPGIQMKIMQILPVHNLVVVEVSM